MQYLPDVIPVDNNIMGTLNSLTRMLEGKLLKMKRKMFVHLIKNEINSIQHMLPIVPLNLLQEHSKALVDLLISEGDSAIAIIQADEISDTHVTYDDIKGLCQQKRKIQKAVELPINYYEQCQELGIKKHSVILLDGPPGTGKTMLANAAAHHTNALFIRIDGSKFIQKCLEKSVRMIQDIFRLAKENSPAIIFIDEFNIIAEGDTDNEVELLLKEVLDNISDVSTNRFITVLLASNDDSNLHPLIHDFYVDKIISFPSVSCDQKRLIFSAITAKMDLSDEVDLEKYVTEDIILNGTDINDLCQEARMLAVREEREIVMPIDFEKGFENIVKKNK